MKSKSWSLQENSSLAELAEHSLKNVTLKEFIKQIDLNKNKLKKIEALLHGTFQSNQYGSGFDFNEIREYKIGDDLRHISWSTTAKTGILHTKEYFAEKEVRTCFLIDVSKSMFCGNKVEPFAKLLAFLLNTSSVFSEKTGGVFFANNVKYHFPMSEPKYQTNIMFQTFMSLFESFAKEISIVSETKEITNIIESIDFTKQFFKKKGLVIIISDFIGFQNKHFEKAVFDLAQNQNIFSFQIFDPIDFNLPTCGYVTLTDPETNERFIVNTDNKLMRRNYQNLMTMKQDKLERFFKTISVNHIVIEKNDFNLVK